MQEIGKINNIIKVFQGRDQTFWNIGLFLILVGIVIARVLKEKKNKKLIIIRRFSKSAIIVGVICVLLSFTSGNGNGLGRGDDSGLGIDKKHDGETKETPSSFDEVIELSVEQGLLEIIIRGNDVYMNGFVCDDDSSLKKNIEEAKRDGLLIRIVDDYAIKDQYDRIEELIGDYENVEKESIN